MPVHAIRIEERLWSTASPLRKQEWRTLAADVVSDDPPWPSREPCTLIAGCEENHLRFVLTGSSEHAIEVARADVAQVISEYASVINRLSQSDLHPAHIQALDMAKRVVHDAGGRQIGILLPELSQNFETRRRFFSLVVSLSVDTTRLGGIRGHRFHAR